jgi:hypothetical protein
MRSYFNFRSWRSIRDPITGQRRATYIFNLEFLVLVEEQTGVNRRVRKATAPRNH